MKETKRQWGPHIGTSRTQHTEFMDCVGERGGARARQSTATMGVYDGFGCLLLLPAFAFPPFVRGASSGQKRQGGFVIASLGHSGLVVTWTWDSRLETRDARQGTLLAIAAQGGFGVKEG